MSLDEFGKEAEKRKRSREDKCIPPQDQCEKDSVKESDKLKRTQWAIVGNGKYSPCASTERIIPAGVYTFNQSLEYGLYLEEVKVNVDDLINFPDSTFSSVLDEISCFWKTKNLFDKYGFLQRRGYLFYGPAGSGKTCLVQRLIQDIICNNGIVILGNCQPAFVTAGLAIFREIEPDRNIICVFEDIDSIIEKFGEADILSMLDGENQISRVLNIATSNYPERLDKRIVSRPRRFDRIIKIGMPTEIMRKIYFKEKLKLNGKDNVDDLVKKTDGLSFAAMAEFVISTKCLGNPEDETIEKLREMSGAKYSSSEFEGNVGFLRK